MNLFQALILGIVQGLTEFLPISSSGHLVLVPYWFGWQIPAEQIFPFDVLVQLGTLLAVIVYFWKDILWIATDFIQGLLHRRPFAEPNSRLGWMLILATIPGGIAGIALKGIVEGAFHSPTATGWFLIVTAGLLLLAEWTSRRTRTLESITWVDALWIGCAQAISIFPGISRSGSTIAAGMSLGLKRPDAARFSFLMSIPIMLAAGLLSVLDLRNAANLASFLPVIVTGFMAAAVVGYLAIHWLLKFLTHRPLTVFAVYCTVVGVLTLLVSIIRH